MGKINCSTAKFDELRSKNPNIQVPNPVVCYVVESNVHAVAQWIYHRVCSQVQLTFPQIFLYHIQNKCANVYAEFVVAVLIVEEPRDLPLVPHTPNKISLCNLYVSVIILSFDVRLPYLNGTSSNPGCINIIEVNAAPWENPKTPSMSWT